MDESTFFAALRDHVPRYVLTVRKFDMCPDEPYFVELHARTTTYQTKGFTLSDCFERILYTMGIDAAPASRALSTAPPPIDATAPPAESKRGKTTSR